MIEAIDTVSLKYPDVKFEMVGKLDEGNPSSLTSKDFKNWLHLHPRVHYTGQTDDIRSFIGESDVVVLPSYREGLPRVILEAMAMEKAVIVTDVPGCRETVIQGKNGYKVKVKDSRALADAMCRMIELDKSELKEMGFQGRELVKKYFDEKVIIEKYLELIHELVSLGKV